MAKVVRLPGFCRDFKLKLRALKSATPSLGRRACGADWSTASLAHLRENVAAAELELPKEAVLELDRIAGPRG